MHPKLIAFHLPQFHPIPENDAWWGKGFTEWTNVTKAAPRFPGHHQPQLPADLGFYDLRLPEARTAQAELAREYGIHGFCYYHYWFNGKRLLERPIEEILASGEPDFPFCLCWANENWTRRWDGKDQEILIAQNYNDHDDREHIHYLIDFFRDPRYIRIDGKPLCLIYRARHLPDPKRTLAIWRAEARKAGVGELFICRVENFFNDRDDPHALGFDASVDFQPDWQVIDNDNPNVVLPDGHVVVDYRDLVETELARPEVPHLRFPGVTPAWDNSARRKKDAFIIADSSPEAYEHWLTETLRGVAARPESQQLVFINAWNEWAEGNHLEPDQRFGRGYLEATQRALETAANPDCLKAPPLIDRLKHDGFVLRDAYAQWKASLKIGKPAARLHDRRLGSVTPARIRVVLDATRCSDEALQQSLNAVAAQLYEHWHLDVLSRHPAPQIASNRLTWHTIDPEAASAKTRHVVDGADEDWITVLNGGDTLVEDALLFVAQDLLDAPPETTLVITDGDSRTSAEETVQTWLAPGCNPDWLRSTLTIGGAVIARRSVFSLALDDIGDSPTDALPLAAVLRALEQDDAKGVRHLASIAIERIRPEHPIPLGFRVELLQQHLNRLGWPARVEHGLSEDSVRLRYEHDPYPERIAIAIPCVSDRAALLRSVEGILNHAAQSPASILLPLTPSASADIRECLRELAALVSTLIRVVEVNAESPAAVANELWAASDADLILFLGEGLVPLDADWLDGLVRHALRPGMGAVGGRVIATDGSLCEGPIRLGQMGVAGSPFRGISATYTGNGNELQLEQNCTAVSMHCLMVRRALLAAMNGFSADRYPDTHADIDLCLRLAETGRRSVWTPFSTVVSVVAPSAPSFHPPRAADVSLLDDWLGKVRIDPYFNRQLTRHLNQPRLQGDPALARESLPWHPVPRIYAQPADTSGCGEIRILTPLRALSRATLAQGAGGTRFLSPWDVVTLAPDTLVTQRIFSDLGLEWLQSYRRHSTSLIVYELDDLLTRIPRENDNARGFPTDIEDRLARGMRLCDRLVVSTEPLAAAFSRFAPETVVMPNLLDNTVWGALQAERRDGKRLRVGWAGSNSHGGDLAMIEDVVKTLASEVDWVFLGYCPATLRPYVREFQPPVAIKNYPEALASLGLDIAIAPLAANAFNEAKSNLKLLEYGALGYPVVCSNVLPYQGGLPVIRVANTTQQWISAIRRLVADRAERATLGDALQAEVRRDWMIDSRLQAWLAAWTR